MSKVEQRAPKIAARKPWSLLHRQDVLDYIQRGGRPQWTTGLVGTRGAMFDGLYVAVSTVRAYQPQDIRALLSPDGYSGLLRRLISESGTIEKKIDVAHWVLGDEPRGSVVHLLYMPPPNGIPLYWDEGVPSLFPWDLFTPTERPENMRHEF